MTSTSSPGLPHHEQVVVARDEASGLRAVIAIHSTALGPSLGGTRMHAYADEAAALADARALSRAMTYKNALAGLAHGGGKGVIIGDPGRDKTPGLLRAYGRLVDSLAGRYVTAADVGTYVQDMDELAQVCRYVTGRSPENGGAGDSGVLTAFGVFEAMRACAARLWGEPTLADRRVAVLGVGKVGRRLARRLVDDGARVMVADVSSQALALVQAEVPEVQVVDVPALAQEDLDVFSPNALGGAVTPAVAQGLRAALVCGGANNQLADPALADVLAARGVLYAPDFLVNCGGVIQVADELHGFDHDRAQRQVAQVFGTCSEVLDAADRDGVTPLAAAEAVAEARIAAGRITTGWEPFTTFPR